MPDLTMPDPTKSLQAAIRLCKGLVLMLFISSLIAVATLAVRGTFSEYVLRWRSPFAPSVPREVTRSADTCETAGTIYARWQAATLEGSATGLTLDAFWLPGWRAKTQEGECRPADWQNYWVTLFDSVDDGLYRLAGDVSVDLKTDDVRDLLLPPGTRPDTSVSGRLPVPVQLWATHERAKRRLTDLVVLLVVIAQLGSLTYLIVGFISPVEAPTMREIIFRPILGAFLAIGVFIANVGLLGVASNGGIFEVRDEALYLLALGAGLFTDRVYQYLRARVEAATRQEEIERRKEATLSVVRASEVRPPELVAAKP